MVTPMLKLTQQEQMVLCAILSLLLVGWVVKACRTAHPAHPPATSSVPMP